MTLHLVRIGIDPHALAIFAAERRLSDDDAGYALHAALAARFGEAAPRPFRYLPDHARRPHLLGYSSDVAGIADAAALPPADALVADLFAAPQVQAMPEAWREGARYGFDVRVRPVVRFGKTIRAARAERADAWQRKAGEIDAYVRACERAVSEGRETGSVDREAVYIAWLAQRLDGAATLDHATLHQFRRSRTRRSTHQTKGARTHGVEGPDAIMTGTLTVTDPAGFAARLANGVGRHAAFGYGMILLSPPGRAG
ncbi:type I-E CRISPR-associated protein Cas6/Cse3/CasE [Sphingomonas fuzhouensis]|uniref:type I-E CRISPR-associated protein Cas6/Cse3/CasE n=1 Tax=Sphingomonas fuzhouensis TaxID=3106033 RepID=UPI002AFE38E4|nr:type I-E CRISPR-associated protein Cas6/Cse3/CasE [Sphingomonas sp. SGZ-02]